MWPKPWRLWPMQKAVEAIKYPGPALPRAPPSLLVPLFSPGLCSQLARMPLGCCCPGATAYETLGSQEEHIALHPITVSPLSSHRLDAAAEAASSRHPFGQLGPSLVQPFQKIHNKLVQNPPRSTRPLRSPRAACSAGGPRAASLPRETLGPGARAPQPPNLTPAANCTCIY